MSNGELESSPSPCKGEGWGEGRIHPRNLRLVGVAKNLRKRQTDCEEKLWYYLRNRRFENLKFRRQYPIKNYIVDFICTDKMLIIELDGGQHADSKKDIVRDKVLRSEGYAILRFWNSDVLENIIGVLEMIGAAIKNPHLTNNNPHPRPLPKRERENTGGMV